MASLSVRKLDDAVYKQLQMRAAANGVSMEEEVRGIILRAIFPAQKISLIFKEHFGEKKGVDLLLPKREPHEPVNFE